jgi:hypothetical protein
MSNSRAVDDAMANLHTAINDALNKMKIKVQESACWTVDELNNETQSVIQGGGFNVTLAQIFEAGACFAAERILASIDADDSDQTEAAGPGQEPPGMVG